MGIFTKNQKEPTAERIEMSNVVGSIELNRAEIPSMRESSNYKYVNYGDDNLYPQFLVALSRSSALHRTLIENKSKMVAGKELYVNDLLLDDWIKSLSGTTSVRVQNLFYNSKYPFRDWIKRTAYDYQIFGAYSTEVIWDSEFEYIKLMKHVDCSKIRSGIMNKNGEIDKYYFAHKWGYGGSSNPTPISVFDTENDKDLNQIIYKRDYNPSLDYYSEPTYVGGLTEINTDAELGLFVLSHIQNGLNPGLIFKIPYSAKSALEKKAIIDELMTHFRGARNNNNPLVLFNNGDLEWVVEQVEGKKIDAQITILGEFLLQQIIIAHRITNPGLVGLMVPGKLGNGSSEEMAYSQAKFDEFVIEPARLMLEETISDVLRTYGLQTKIKIK